MGVSNSDPAVTVTTATIRKKSATTFCMVLLEICLVLAGGYSVSEQECWAAEY